MMEQVDARHADPGSVQIHYDYDFHLAIAKSSRNAYIFGFLLYLRPMIVPKFQLGYVVPAEQKDRYYDRIHAEHQKIVEAIEAQDSSAARNSMRKHLANSLQRVRGLAPAAGIETAKVGPDVVAQELFAGIGAKLSHS
jgi:GntR family transcriptional repressor for pyruvate dehydrogenase complex